MRYLRFFIMFWAQPINLLMGNRYILQNEKGITLQCSNCFMFYPFLMQFSAHSQFTAKNVTRAAAGNLSRLLETSFSCFSNFNAYPESLE